MSISARGNGHRLWRAVHHRRPRQGRHQHESTVRREHRGAAGQGQVAPLPMLSNAEGSGIIDQIRSKVTNADGTPKMTGRYQDAIVYNLPEIFAQLGATNEGNRERNLARPNGCTFGSVSADVKCQIWQDLVILGPKQTCGIHALRARADGQAELLLHGIAAQSVGRAAGHLLLRHSIPRPSSRALSSISSSSRRSTHRSARGSTRSSAPGPTRRRSADSSTSPWGWIRRRARAWSARRRSSTWTGTGARTGRTRRSPTMAARRSSPASP